MYDELMEAMEEALSVNFKNKLYRETFLLIERAILQRKMSAIHGANKVLMINCTECAQDMATVYC